jgi:tripeptide aminopeptidase
MSVGERLKRYCMVDTQSDPDSGTHPSSMKELDLARMLVRELQELGLKDAAVDEHGYVYAHLESNVLRDVETVGFIAHMDTSPDFSGTGVHPRILEHFDGQDIELGHGRVIRMEDFPTMRELKGKTLMVTDGSTLLGADDKAGITAIMEALAYWQAHPEVAHGPIAVAFTPDEEIGEGTLFFDLKTFGASSAYTMDGDSVHVFADENFNAAGADLVFHGFSVHPGGAKDRLINAGSLAAQYHARLPQEMTPEHTEGRQGFVHLTSLSGNVESASLHYILRDHDAGLLAEKKKMLSTLAEEFNARYGEGTVALTIKDQYRNMKTVLDAHPEVSRRAWKAMEDLGLEPVRVPIRGGTDGAELSYKGLPCPNLGNGGGNFHGPYEYCVLEELEQAAALIRRIAALVVEEEE